MILLEATIGKEPTNLYKPLILEHAEKKGEGGLHAGEDWNDSCFEDNDVGAPVYAVAHGEVVGSAARSSGSGKPIGYVLVLKHKLPDGNSIGVENLYSLYLHIDVADGLDEGKPVTRDQQVGTIADISAVPPHLHFELRKDIDPEKDIDPAGDLWPSDNDETSKAYYGPILTDKEIMEAKEKMERDGLTHDPSDFIDNNRPSANALETGRIPRTFRFERDLAKGMCRYEVRYLQILLNGDPDTRLEGSGSGSPGNEISNFGPATEDAVKRFQEKYLGVPEGTGRVDAETRAKLNDLLSGDFSSPCHTLENPTIPQQGFATPYDVQTGALLISAECSGSETARMSVGDGAPATFIWPLGHQWNAAAEQWEERQLQCAAESGDWCVAKATIDIPLGLGGGTTDWFLAYMCQWNGEEWKCGCRDKPCQKPQWSIQGVEP